METLSKNTHFYWFNLFKYDRSRAVACPLGPSPRLPQSIAASWPRSLGKCSCWQAHTRPCLHTHGPPHPTPCPAALGQNLLSEIRVVSYEKCIRVAESPCKADLEGRPVKQLSGPPWWPGSLSALIPGCWSRAAAFPALSDTLCPGSLKAHSSHKEERHAWGWPLSTAAQALALETHSGFLSGHLPAFPEDPAPGALKWQWSQDTCMWRRGEWAWHPDPLEQLQTGGGEKTTTAPNLTSDVFTATTQASSQLWAHFMNWMMSPPRIQMLES